MKLFCYKTVLKQNCLRKNRNNSYFPTANLFKQVIQYGKKAIFTMLFFQLFQLFHFSMGFFRCDFLSCLDKLKPRVPVPIIPAAQPGKPRVFNVFWFFRSIYTQ